MRATSLVILKTRPQGDRPAQTALARRGVTSIRPVEVILSRKTTRGGKRETIRTERTLLPSYLLAEPAPHLDNALADMSLREPRKDVQAVLGVSTERQLAPILEIHNRVIDTSAPTVSVGDIAVITGGPFATMRVSVVAIRGQKARVQAERFQIDVHVASLENYTAQRVPLRP